MPRTTLRKTSKFLVTLDLGPIDNYIVRSVKSRTMESGPDARAPRDVLRAHIECLARGAMDAFRAEGKGLCRQDYLRAASELEDPQDDGPGSDAEGHDDEAQVVLDDEAGDS